MSIANQGKALRHWLFSSTLCSNVTNDKVLYDFGRVVTNPAWCQSRQGFFYLRKKRIAQSAEIMLKQADCQLICEEVDRAHNYEKKSRIKYSNYRIVESWSGFSEFGPVLYLYSFVYKDKVFFYTEEEGLLEFILVSENEEEAIKEVEKRIKANFESAAATCYVEEEAE